ncbi:MAG: hypothetical protein JW795_08515 [Chitinivibrionales bacterium]|nr:hypothetical protein [Chitinivibrionales bacterium]
MIRKTGQIFFTVHVMLYFVLFVFHHATAQTGANRFALTEKYYSERDDLAVAIVKRFGPQAAMADFIELKSLFTGKSSTFCDSVGLKNYRDGALCLNNGAPFWNGYRHYFIERHNSIVPAGWLVHNHIDNKTVSLGSWYNVNKRIIVKMPYSCDIDQDNDGFTTRGGDFNDLDSTIHPGASEICHDGIDQDCDGIDLQCLCVPGDFPTIQAAIDQAADDDIVQVNNGTYSGDDNTNIDFHGKRITVRSMHGAASCTISCTLGRRGFTFQSGEDSTTVLTGFTVTGGQRALGGAVYCANNSSPVIEQCILFNNRATAYGGAIYCMNASPTIRNCLISQNYAMEKGGGLFCSQSSSPSIEECILMNNATSTSGGALYVQTGAPRINRCRFMQNSSNNAEGGAIYISDASVHCVNCMFTDNFGAALYSVSASATLVTLVNCTVVKNRAIAYAGGLTCRSASSALVKNCIFWNNTYGTTNEISASGSSGARVTVSFSDILGGYAGEGNINADPMFLNSAEGDYHLTVDSPCIDTAGTDSAPGDDIDGEGRPFDAGIDIGADEFCTQIK